MTPKSTKARARPRSRSQIAKLSLSAASIVLFVAVAELTVRLVGPDLTVPGRPGRLRFDQSASVTRADHVRDRRLGWRLKPGQSGGMRINSLGFRTPEFSPAKPAGTFRMVFFGDSNPLGFGLTDETWPYPNRVEQILERYLPDTVGIAFQSLNLGVDGYSSHQARLLAQELLPGLNADFVSVQVGFNDYCLAPIADGPRAFGQGILEAALERSHAFRWFRRALVQITGRSPALRDPVRRVSPAAFEENLRAVVGMIRSAGALPVLITTPIRPSGPLIINEERIEEDGRPIWITQNEWIMRRLQAGGLNPPNQPLEERYIPIVEEGLREHPDWALLRFMLATAHRMQGREEIAAAYDADWRRTDRERDVFGAYMEIVRRIAAEEGAPLIDVPALIETYLSSAGVQAPSDLFLDFIHLDGPGHVVVATEIARVVLTAIAGPTSRTERSVPAIPR